jgi:DNA repair protein RecN (Recombination protein N)
MLQSLALRDFVIVDQLELDFVEGFSVLTGETGAGKSILLDALGLALGERADSSQIREGCQRAEITAIFRIDKRLETEMNTWLGAHDLPLEDGGKSLILKRSIDNTGRSRSFINGSSASLNQLREAGDRLVDIHGQHAHQLLLKTGAQRELLDRHAGLDDLITQVSESFKAMSATQKKLEQAESAGADIQRERERLEWQLEELNDIAPQANEWAEIKNDHSRLANAAKIIQGSQATIDLLSESDHSIESQLNQAKQEIDALAEHDPALHQVAESLNVAQIQLDEALHSLNRYLQKMDLDPDRLAEVDARMQVLHTAARKYKVNPDDLAQLQDQEAKFIKLAKELSQKRQKAAQQLSKEISTAMQTLAMSGGQLQIMLSPSEPSAKGIDHVEYLIAAHAGSTPRPLAKVASGGELARISLAISVITSQASFTPTLIFDEVDSGIGGAVAQTVGELLKQLGQSHQILCVTHLAQVAAQGNHHFKVAKTQMSGKTSSDVSSLGRQERIEEIARMLGGTTITDTTRRHARELLGQS